MATEPAPIDERLLERARQLALARNCSVDEILEQALDRLGPPSPASESVIGLLADEPELADRLIEDVYRTRESSQLRRPGHG